jgi:hypothetical protein
MYWKTCSFVTDAVLIFCQTSGMTSQTLAATLEGFLSGSNNAVVIEDGAVTFDLGQAKYSVSGETNKCLLHLWSQERNVVRRVLVPPSSTYAASATLEPVLQNAPPECLISACSTECCGKSFLN